MEIPISLQTAKILQEWGCSVKCICFYGRYSISQDYSGSISAGSEIKYDNKEFVFWDPRKDSEAMPTEKTNIPAYDLIEIICNHNGMAEAFFVVKEYSYELGAFRAWHKIHTTELKNYLLENKTEEAEKHLLENTIFNPKNK